MREESKELRREFHLKEMDNGFFSEDERREALRRISDVAIAEKVYSIAIDINLELNNQEILRILGEKCFEAGEFNDAYRVFKHLNNREGILRVICAPVQMKDDSLIEAAAETYLGENTRKLVLSEFKKWSKSYGFETAQSFYPQVSANMAYNLIDKYDIGIGIAKSGFFTAYLCSLFGLNTKIAHLKRKGRGATFKWITPIEPEDIKDMRVAVFDDDVATGRTTGRALREIEYLEPKTIDLILNLNPIEQGGRSYVANIPKGFDEIYYPAKFSYRSFDKVVERLERILCQ